MAHRIRVPGSHTKSSTFRLEIPTLVRARAYNDLYQHPGCVKNSIKIGSILMLVLTAPESGSLGSRFDAGFNTVHFDPQNGP